MRVMTIGTMRRAIWVLSASALAVAAMVLVSMRGDGERASAHTRVEPLRYEGPAPVPAPRDVSEYVGPITRDEPVEEHGDVPPPPVPEDDPSRIFRLVTVFLVQGEAGERGFAAIVYREQETLYSQMAVLPENYVLEKILSDSVVVEKEGKRWSLDRKGHARVMEPAEEPIEEAKPSETGVTLEIAGYRVAPPEPFEDSSGASGERYRIPKKAIEHILKNLHKLIHDVEIKLDVSKTDGQMTGVRVYPKEGSIPYQVGLRDGDVIRAVDGKLVKSMMDVMDIFRRYQKGPPEKTRLLVERDGEIIVKELLTQDAR